MGTGASRRSQITPVVAQISVQPKVTPLDQSLQSQESGAGNSSDDTLTPRKASSSRNSSRQHERLSTPATAAGRRGSARRSGAAVGAGGVSRPLSTVSGRQLSGRGLRLVSPTSSGLPFKRELDPAELGQSQRSQRVHTIGHLFQEVSAPESDVIFLRLDSECARHYPATCCQLCGNQFTNLGVRAPMLLLCGHSYCSSCLEKACESYDYPAALKCGICQVVTPLDQLTPRHLPQNEAVLDLIGSKEYTAISSGENPESCAECEQRMARVYCSECSASYCDTCSRRAHEGSRVRARHKPVSINLKPRPQPTCRKHPGQSCMLYCVTDKQPMCVLCKFYNQHRFHKFELMTKVAAKYTASVSENLAKLEELEKEQDKASKALYAAVTEINDGARKVQERLERHFTEMKKTYLAALERREAMLLSLVDRQVEVKQDILAEMRLEVAAARARVLAAREEATQLLKLNPVSALLSRRHMDLTFDRALRQTINSPKDTIQPDVPLSLLPDITPALVRSLEQHGAILQLPPKPEFSKIVVTTNTIALEWEVKDRHSDVSSDRTLTFSLHCYGDIPYKLKMKLMFKKRITKLVTPESGFEDMSELSSESNNTFPSLPPSVLGSRNVNASIHHNMEEKKAIKEEEDELLFRQSISSSNNNNKVPLLPEPIRLPRKRLMEDSKLPQLAAQSANASLNLSNPLKVLTATSTEGILNLPPLIINKQAGGGAEPLPLAPPVPQDSTYSVTTSGVYEEDLEDHMSTVDESEVSDPKATESTSSLSDTSCVEQEDEEPLVNGHTELGRYCQGRAFEEIYCGEDTSFHYSGLVAGASYFFRIRCHNAAGWGPWSDTVKCLTTS